MNKENLKIQSYESGVASLPDYPSDEGYTAERLKAAFDARSDNEIKQKHNALVDAVEEEISLHSENKNNPHGVTKEQVGLSNVDNTSDMQKPISTAVRIRFEALGNELGDFEDIVTRHLDDANNPHGVTKEQVGLSNVDNTSDMNKPVSRAVQSALDGVASEAKQQAEDVRVGFINGFYAVDRAIHDDYFNYIPTTYATKEEVAEGFNNLSSALSADLSEKAGILKLTTDTAKAHSVTDSENHPIVSASLYGESSQNGTPTPDNPIDIVSVENPTITISSGEDDTEPQEVTLVGITLRGLKDSSNNWVARDELVLSDNSVKLIQRIASRDLSTFSWTKENNYKYFIVINYDGIGPEANNKSANILCTHLLRDTASKIFGHTNNNRIGVNASATPQIWVWIEERAELSKDAFIPTVEGYIVNYELAEPIETDITDTEAGQALLALHTNYPDTTIVCDADCSITYKADTTNAYYSLLHRIEELKA